MTHMNESDPTQQYPNQTPTTERLRLRGALDLPIGSTVMSATPYEGATAVSQVVEQTPVIGHDLDLPPPPLREPSPHPLADRGGSMSAEEQRWADLDVYTASEDSQSATLSVASDVTDGFDENGNVRFF